MFVGWRRERKDLLPNCGVKNIADISGSAITSGSSGAAATPFDRVVQLYVLDGVVRSVVVVLEFLFPKASVRGGIYEYFCLARGKVAIVLCFVFVLYAKAVELMFVDGTQHF